MFFVLLESISTIQPEIWAHELHCTCKVCVIQLQYDVLQICDGLYVTQSSIHSMTMYSEIVQSNRQSEPPKALVG